jgi:hypothetical protein
VVYLIAAIAAVVIVVAVVAVVLRRRSRPPEAPTPAARPSRYADDPAPMTGLESALAAVTDRSGRPLRDQIDAEAAHVDELRVADDTGPLLRRALDHVERHDHPAEPTDDPSATPAPTEPPRDA